MDKFFGDFTDQDQMANEFDVDEKQLEYIKSLDIICAAYNQESYEGDAFVLFREDGKLFEVDEHHCSCYGLSNFNPEPTTKEALLLRGDNYGVWETYGKQLKEIINGLE